MEYVVTWSFSSFSDYKAGWSIGANGVGEGFNESKTEPLMVIRRVSEIMLYSVKCMSKTKSVLGMGIS